MNTGLNILRNALDNATTTDMPTILYAVAGVVVLLVLRMVKVSLDNAGCRARIR